ncbi:cytochrome P450 family protein [Streptomyces tsukubensis]|uniref:cytochrome P450 family protein n=1 Tax=Streptomyces tsukubensis TaxID=83656 RepID=UPI001D0590AD|nr:cytochrome P450 [Streptomyces tsukubensis]
MVAVELPGGIRAWAPTRHRVLKDLINNPLVSKDPRLHWPLWNSEWIAERPEAHWIYTWCGVRNMFTSYGVDHRRLRTLIAPAFTSRRTRAMQPVISRITDELLRGLRDVPAGESVDLRKRFAYPLPMGVICELFGLNEDERHTVAGALEKVMDTTVSPEVAGQVLENARTALGALVARKRVSPGNDLTSDLIEARDGSDRLDEGELVDTLILVLTAGHETTVNLIGNAVVALLEHPDQLAAVLAGDVPWENVIEETLRWAPSITSLPVRFATETIEVADVTIERGDAILATFGIVGWDPDYHGEQAGEFNVRRAPGKHLAFGHGVHRCLGAPLAQAEALTALPALFAAFPNIALVPGQSMERYPSFIAHGHKAPLVWLRG